MVKYLSFDGVDDYLKTPSITFDKIIMDFSADQKASVAQIYFDLRSGAGVRYLIRNSDLDSWSGLSQIKVNGTVVTNNTAFIPKNTRVLLEVSVGLVVTDDVNIFSHNNGGIQFMKGLLYDAKFYNGTALVAHYDMATETVQDQSGNGNHATLTGGTWMDDGVGGSTPEIITASPISFTGQSSFSLSGVKVINGSIAFSSETQMSIQGVHILQGSVTFEANTSFTANGQKVLVGDLNERTPVGHLSMQTSIGLVRIPVYQPSDVSYSALRIALPNGLVGCFDLVSDATLPIRIQTPRGVMGIKI